MNSRSCKSANYSEALFSRPAKIWTILESRVMRCHEHQSRRKRTGSIFPLKNKLDVDEINFSSGTGEGREPRSRREGQSRRCTVQLHCLRKGSQVGKCGTLQLKSYSHRDRQYLSGIPIENETYRGLPCTADGL